ncbi:hypothetical protein QZH41_000916 [Actinostola sp. cb2023]|nr:hypothetical protein QZH41_000916 [Actinostola sp. cb2023]
MSKDDVRSTSRIANVRIFVEKAIRRVKEYRILSNEIPVSLLPLLDDIINLKARRREMESVKKSVKEIRKVLTAISKEKECLDLKVWIKPCENHLYWSAMSTYDGNGQVIWAKFKSFLSHITDKHDDLDDPLFNKCLHGPIPHRTWLRRASRVNTTRLKERILSAFPEMSAHAQGRDVLLISNRDVGDAIRKAHNQDTDDEAMHLAKAAKIVRRDIFKQRQSFNGTFTPGCQDTCIPPSLKTLVNMILRGPSSEKHDSRKRNPNQACRSISQLLLFNTTVRDTKESSVSRHNRERECPLPIYVGLKIHGLTRARNLIDALFDLGLCISYDRVLNISTDVANSVCARFERDGVVCPPKLRSGLFTTAAVDNIDHNPSSTTARDSFHGTAISLAQHPTADVPGTTRGINVIDGTPQAQRKITPLPSQYTDVQPTILRNKEIYAPPLVTQMKTIHNTPHYGYDKEIHWLGNVDALLGKESLDADDFISWAAFHASNVQPSLHEPAIISLMPMFLEHAHTAPMILHSMNVIQSAVQHVNPGQVPVIAMDQPIYALAKQIQWNWPQTHGENNFVIMFGGLHIEMAAFRALGKWIDKSGWTTVLSNAGVATPGVVDSFISASHITRTRRAHQITSACLHILQRRAYTRYLEEAVDDEIPVPFTEWKDNMSEKYPQFLYWSRVMELQLCCFQLVRAFRQADFHLYVESLLKIIPWMFALDHTNYARWLPVHIRDMQELEVKHPEVFQQFTNGSFAVHKTKRAFSAIALDHAHEQENASVKGEGGAVGLTENPGALRRWMVAGPEIARMVQEFENVTSSDTSLKHHEQEYGPQASFKADLQSVVSTFEELGNPFMEESEDLMALDTKDIMSSAVVQTVKNVVKIGQEQYDSYVRNRLQIERSKPITDTIKKNNLPLVHNSARKDQSKQKAKIAELKNDCSLFSRLYIACQCRDGNLDDFFRHENQPWPPSLSEMGEMRSGQKADLVKCLEKVCKETTETPIIEATVLDGAVIVQMLGPRTATTFQEYIDMIFKPFMLKQLETVKRVDIVWDVYKPDSLKKGAREKRGIGIRRRVLPSTRIPSNWHSFLRVDDNKEELFHLLAEQSVLIHVEGKELYSTYEEKALCSSERNDLSNLEPCTQEEADTRILLHVLDASLSGHRKIMIRTIDTDVVVLAISIFHVISVDELWISYGTGRNFRYLAIHEIATKLGQERSRALPLFHAITGCDTVSFFAGRGKKRPPGRFGTYVLI